MRYPGAIQRNQEGFWWKRKSRGTYRGAGRSHSQNCGVEAEGSRGEIAQLLSFPPPDLLLCLPSAQLSKSQGARETCDTTFRGHTVRQRDWEMNLGVGYK